MSTTDAGILGVRNWRRRKGISLETIAEATKLSKRQLEAIESGEFSRLPGGIYNTSYIKQYARAIDFDEGDLLGFYREACSPPPEAPAGKNPRTSRIAGPLFEV